MGDIALFSANREYIGVLYKLFGKNAELLIDHAWGIEPTTIADVKAYKPDSNSLGAGQVLQHPTNYEHTKLIVWEMADTLSLDLVSKRLVTDQLVLTVNYDQVSLESGIYDGEVTTDYYGREVPKHAHGTINLTKHTSSTKKITEAVMELFDRIVNKELMSRRLNLTACNVLPEDEVPDNENYEQMSIFDLEKPAEQTDDKAQEQKERALQEAMLEIKQKYGKNAVLKAKNLKEGGTAIERNQQIGGHKA
jgi:DNA polymerase V